METQDKETGFTLIEILIALMILGLVFVSILLSFKQSYSVNWQSHERAVAVNYAREKLEYLKRFDNDGKGRDSAMWNITDSKVDGGIRYDVTTRVITGSGIYNSETAMVPVKATVSWTSHGQDFTISIDTCYVKQY